ncbi:lamin tail domain-containing protein [Myxococcus sp. K15C18031901]|uniref:lamin tail domain-containing protein n=1 Tax=Myxococcus dinghuensis TaxID=2906761 RepID=UPI0020A77B92|nr:lamin tail domain-containing protein [Myxococcus dinghuensis]MCP3101115.1 lamin tail domain-containing protein [Myxococcus dinghuensis]
MSARVSSLTRLLALSVLCLGVSLGCKGDDPQPTPQPPVSEVPDAAVSQVVLTPERELLANGVDQAIVTIAVRQKNGLPLKGRHVEVAVEGEGNAVQPAAETNAEGLTTATVTSTRAGVKRVTVTVLAKGSEGPVVLNARPTLTFVSPPATRLEFSDASHDAIAGRPIPGLEVRFVDDWGHVVQSANGAVTLSLSASPAAAELTGTLTQTAVNGVAVFPDVVLTLASTGYRLDAGSDGVAPARTATFDVVANDAVVLSTSAPRATTAGEAVSLEAKLSDAMGNVATGYRGTVVVTSSDGLATLPVSHTFTEQDRGVFTFTGVTLRRAGAQTVTIADATPSSSLRSVQDIDVAAGPLAALAFATVPERASIHVTLPPVSVALQDAFGNAVSAGSPPVSVALDGMNPSLLTGVLQVTPVDGVATFSSLQVHTDGVVHLTASASGLTGARSPALTIVDDVPPAKPVLSVAALTTDSATVTWLAVGDDGDTGTATSQQLRYSTQPITTPAEFQAATPVGGVGAPAAPGTTESATLTGLSSAQVYHVVLAVTDNQGNTTYSNDLMLKTRNALVKQIAFTQQPANGVAGVALADIRVALLDANGAVAPSADSPVLLTLVGGSAFEPRQVVAVNGVATFTGVRVDRAGEFRFSASAEGLSVESGAFVISAAAVHHLVLTGPASPVVAGQARDFELAARDAFDNLVPGYTGTVHFTSTDPQAGLPADYTFTAADAGHHTFTGVTLATSGTRRVTATDTAAPSLTASVELEVTSDVAHHLEISGLAASVGAGTQQGFTVSVRDNFGNLVPSYRGVLAFQSDDTQATLPAEYRFTAADAGQHTFTATLKTAGARALTAKELLGALAVTASTQVQPGVTRYLVMPTSVEPHTVGVPLQVSVMAWDEFSNRVPGYRGTVKFSSDDTTATLPADYTFTEADAGEHVFTVTFARAGDILLMFQDTADESLINSEFFWMIPDAAASLTVSLVPGPYTAGVAYGFTVTAKDRFGNVATAYAGTVNVATTDPQAEPVASHAFTSQDKGAYSFSVALRTAGAQTVTFSDTTLGASASQSLTVAAAAPTRLRIAASPASVSVRQTLAEVRVSVDDAFGNTVPTASASVTVSLTGSAGATSLRGTLTRDAASGVAAFADLAVDEEGQYSLVAQSVGSGFTLATAALTVVDDVAPAAVATLSATVEGDEAIRLRWRATGDDGLDGRAARYELRYAQSPLTDANFGTGTLVSTSLPGEPGTEEQAVASGLSPGRTYHFAVRVFDGSDNASALTTTSLRTPSACDDVVCEPRAATCAENGVDRVTYAAECVLEAGAPTCQYTPTATACTGLDGVCFQGACTTAAAPAANELVITELMHSPTNGTTKYVELTNTTDHPVNINGVSIEVVSPVAGLFTLDRGAGAAVVVGAHDSFVFASDANLQTNGGVLADVAYGNALDLAPTGQFAVRLEGVVLDTLMYDEAFPSAAGAAISLSSVVQGAHVNRYAWFWCLATEELAGGNHGSPGDASDTCGITYDAPVDNCVIDTPKSFSEPLAPNEEALVTSRFAEGRVTSGNTAGNDYFPFVAGELGYGTDPDHPESWTWVPASFATGYVAEGRTDDQMEATLRIPAVGNYLYGFRYRFTRGPAGSDVWTYCDQDGVVSQGVTPHYGTVSVEEPPPVANHVVISEVSGRGVSAQTDEYIELYNPTNADVNIGGWLVQYKSATGAAYSGSVTIPAGKVIRAHGYFLVAHTAFTGGATTPPDATYSNFDMAGSTTGGGHVRIGPGLFTNPNEVAVDVLGWGTANAPEGTAAPAHPAAGGSLERKALPTSTSATMAVGGIDANKGNGTDSNQNAQDFVTRATRQPQCSTSPTERP